MFGNPVPAHFVARAENLPTLTLVANNHSWLAVRQSTLSVYPAASIPLVAAERGTAYVIVNRGPTDHDALSSVTLRLEGDVMEIVPPAIELAFAIA